MARDYKKLEIWQLSYQLALSFYKITEQFPEHEGNNLTSQIRRSAISIPLNIAEGTSRFTKKGYLQFLGYAYGSIRELQVLLEFARDLRYIPIATYNFLNEETDKVSRKLFTFMKKVDKEVFFTWFK